MVRLDYAAKFPNHLFKTSFPRRCLPSRTSGTIKPQIVIIISRMKHNETSESLLYDYPLGWIAAKRLLAPGSCPWHAACNHIRMHRKLSWEPVQEDRNVEKKTLKQWGENQLHSNCLFFGDRSAFTRCLVSTFPYVLFRMVLCDPRFP